METRKNISKKAFLILSLCMIIGIAATRGITIKHNFAGQPDEHVFYGSTEMLMYDLLYGEQYEPVKPYPEGTYVFRLPFHLLAQVAELEDDYTDNVRLWGRISSVFYFSLGGIIGLWLVLNVLNGGKAGAIIYILTTCFSLFQIEQSRYGTFDPISFFVLMLALLLLTQYIRKSRKSCFAAAAFCLAVAAAGKYSLAYFFVLPISLLFLQKQSKREKLIMLCIMGLSALLGFLLFSPSILINPRFFINTVLGGLNGYIVGGNPEGYSTIPESLFSAIVYQLFYSDLPLSTIFMVFGALSIHRMGKGSIESMFFGFILPLCVLVFLIYNCLLTTFFLRTLFPYYCIAALYAAAGLGQLCKSKRICGFAVLLCALMLVRSSYFISVMADYSAAEKRAEAFSADTEASNTSELVYLGEFFVANELKTTFKDYDTSAVSLGTLHEGEFPEIQSGQLIITDSLEHGWAKLCIFPPEDEVIINITQGWEKFKADNQQYYVGTLFPQHYYWLFGYWVHGSTGTNYEFPNNYLYYKP